MANYLLTQTGEEVQDILNQAPETEAGLQQEVTNREQADTAMQQAIAAETTARADADATLDGKIDAETSRAEAAEGTLDDKIDQEVTDRTDAVAAEATARADADATLDGKIDAETTRAEAAEGTLTDAINKEMTDRTAAVAAEATARQQADTTLQQAISTEAQARSAADTEILGNLQTEARTRLNADTDLQDHIDDEETRAKAAEATLQSNIDALGQSGGAAVAAERERAQAAESTLDGKIDAETDRAEDAEQTLTDAIAQEVTDRTAAVTAEATARADADAALQTSINGKQATIADLADIRSGAAAGATAYQKPATGIPATDMSAEVQTSLDKADSALQEHQSLADYYTKSEVDSLITTPDQEYVSVTATAQTTAVTDLLPATGAADTIYRVGNWDGTQYDPTMYALFAWNGTTYVCLAVRSFVGEVYDVSVNHPDGQGNPTPYADLTAALGTGGANIPDDLRKGGMSVKFVQSSDNKYVQYRYMGTAVTGTPNPFLDAANWQGVDEEPTAKSKNLIDSGGVFKMFSEYGYFDFELGTILTDGTESNVNKRARTNFFVSKLGNIFSVKENSGLNIVVAEYSDYNGSLEHITGWVTSYKIANSNIVRIAVKYTDERVITSSDFEYLKNNIVITDVISTDIDAINNSIEIINRTLFIHDFEQGGYNPSNGSKSTTTKRIRSKKRYKFSYGESINVIVPTGSNQSWIVGIYAKDEQGTEQYTASSWKSQSEVYTFEQDCEAVFLVKKNSEADITPEEDLCKFIIKTGVVKDILDLQEIGINNIIGQIDTILSNLSNKLLYVNNDITEWEQGSYNPGSGSKSTTTTRIRTKSRTSFSAGQSIYILPKDNQKWIIGIYTKDEQEVEHYVASSWSYAFTKYTFTEDCEAVFIVSKKTDADITAEERNCTILIGGITYLLFDELFNKLLTDIPAAIEPIQHSIDYLYKEENDDSNFEQGSYDTTGKKSSTTTRIRTKNRTSFSAGDSIILFPFTDRRWSIGIYTKDEQEVEHYTYINWTSKLTIYTFEQDCEVVFMVSKGNNSATITTSERNCLFITSGSLFELIPKILSNSDRIDGLYNLVGTDDAVVNRNLINSRRLTAMSSNGLLFQICLATDVHNDQTRFENAVRLTEGFSTIKALLGLGDYVSDNMLVRSNADYIFSKTANMTKPYLHAIGNHDVGNREYIGACIDHSEEYSIWMQPFHDRGLLNSTENPNGKGYWYKDFVTDNYSIRLIALNAYDEDIQYDETKWRAIEYDSSYPVIVKNTTYQPGSKVNAQNITANSFELITQDALTTPNDAYMPGVGLQYKLGNRGRVAFRYEQLAWFANILNTTPEGYGIVVALHPPFSPECHNQSNRKFGNKARLNQGTGRGNNFQMQNDVLANIINAFMNRTTYADNIKMISHAAYMNTIGEGENAYAYSVNFDFSNAKGTFMCWLGGHVHNDLVFKHDTYNQYQISPTWTNQGDWNVIGGAGGGLPTDIITSKENNLANDCLTVIAFDVANRKIKLAKLGQDVTIDGEPRDYEVIDLQ